MVRKQAKENKIKKEEWGWRTDVNNDSKDEGEEKRKERKQSGI